jgi:multidrug efflux pump subunit AcrA (membrane-fusion protein)
VNRHNLTTLTAAAAFLAFVASCSSNTSDPAAAETPAEKPPTDSVTLSAESLKLVGVEVTPVSRGHLSMTLRSPGRISVNVNRTAKVTSTLEGRIRTMTYDIGAEVRAGDTMVLIDSPELLNKPLDLKAPISGRVIERHGTVGEAVDRAKELYTISDLANLWAIAEIKEKDIAMVQVGQDATLRVLAFPAEVFTGKVVLLGDEIEAKTRTLEVRILMGNTSGKLKPGMFADVEIVTDVLNGVLVIPDDALQTLEDQQVVFVGTDGGTFTKRTVRVGHEQNGRVEIVDGLREGERVVTTGSFLLKSEMLKNELAEE